MTNSLLKSSTSLLQETMLDPLKNKKWKQKNNQRNSLYGCIIAKNLFGSFAHNYLYDKGFDDCISPPMIDKLDKVNIFQHRFGAFRSIVNRGDIIITNVFDDNMAAEFPSPHTEPDLHAIKVALADLAASSSSKDVSLLDPTAHAPIASSRVDATFLQLSPVQPVVINHFSL